MGQKLLDMTAEAGDLLTKEQSDLMFREILKTFQGNYPYKIHWRANNPSRDQENVH
jgi:hypothetical protein